MYFHIIENANIILVKGGVFKQAKAYRNDENEVFAAYGGGFVRMTRNGTSVPNLNHISYDLKPVKFTPVGFMVLDSGHAKCAS